MNKQYPIKYVARAILHNGKTVQYFSSPAFVKETLYERDDDNVPIIKYHIEYCEQYGHPRIEDYPYETGCYYGKVFDSKNACEQYVTELNIRFPHNYKSALSILDSLPESSLTTQTEPDCE